MTEKKSPFKFLDPYKLQDKDIFFGRDEEIEQLYKMVFQTNLLLIYGQSGTGKTSLIQCGLAGHFNKTDWFDIFIRRRGNINTSLRKALQTNARTELDPDASLPEMVESLYLDYFRPIYLLFDQFEELFILGTKSEQEQFITDIASLLKADLSCKIIIVLREEYLAHLYNFEKVIPELFNKRLRVEPMGFGNVEQVVEGSCNAFDICLEPPQETIEKIIDQISDGKSGVQLSYLQVYLDELWQKADHSGEEVSFTPELVKQVGDISIVLAQFLEKQTNETQAELEKTFAGAPTYATRLLLNTFATLEGTKKPIPREEIPEGQLTAKQVDFILDRLDKARILREADGIYELSHDTLARRIADQRSVEEVTLLEVVKLVQDRREVFARTYTFLSAKEIQLVENQEEKLRERGKLNAEEWEYIKNSKSHNRRQKRRTRLAVSAIMVILTLFSVYSWKLKLAANEKERIANDKTLEANFNLAKLFEEKAGYALNNQNFQEAWLYQLEALRQEIGEQKKIPVSLGRLMLPEMRPSKHYFKGTFDVSDQVRALDLDVSKNLLFVGALKQIEIWDIDQREKKDSLFVWLEGNSTKYDLKYGKQLPEKTTAEEIWDLAYNTSNQQLAFCLAAEKEGYYQEKKDTINHVIFIWDRKEGSGSSVKLLYGHHAAIKNLAYSPDGSRLASSAFDGKILLWGADGQATKLEITNDTITSLAFSPDSKKLAAGYLNGKVKVWNLDDTEASPEILQLHRHSVRKLFFMPGKTDLLVSGSELGQIVMYDLENKKKYLEWIAHNGAVNNLYSSPDSNFLISTSPNRLRFWDWKQKDTTHIIQVDIRGSVSDLVSSSTYKQLFTGTLDKKVRVLDLAPKFFNGDEPPFMLEDFMLAPQPTLNREKLTALYESSLEKFPYDLKETNLELNNAAQLDSLRIAYYGTERTSDDLYKFYENNTLRFSNKIDWKYPKFSSGAIQLTPEKEKLGAAILLKADLAPPFEISFEYAISNTTGAYGDSYNWKDWPGDGLVFMFFKNRSGYWDASIPNGGSRGFMSDGTGYGIHFATFNTNDIFLVDGNDNVLSSYSSFQRKQVQPTVYSGGSWRQVTIRVTKNSIVVRYESELAFIWEGGDLDQTFKGVGFAAATGDADSKHEIRNILIETNVSNIADVSVQESKQARITGNRVNVRSGPTVSDNKVGQFDKEELVELLESRVVSDDRTLICKEKAELEVDGEDNLRLGNGIALTKMDPASPRPGYFYVEVNLKKEGVKRGWIREDQLQVKSAAGERWYKVRKDFVEGWVLGQFVEPITN